VAAVKVGFAALKNSVASFDDGGIPVRDGLGMLHKTDVTLNPTSENPMMRALIDRLTDAVGRGKNVILNVDGRELGRAAIGDISRRNRQLPRGRDVFDESRYNG